MAANMIPQPAERHVTGQVIQNMEGLKVTTKDVQGLLSHVADGYPELSEVMRTTKALITHLETLRREALLPLSLGHTENVATLLTQQAIVEVQA